jgi:hypothetical protein
MQSSSVIMFGLIPPWAVSLDHLVGAAEQLRRKADAQGFRGLEIDDELELRGCLDREIGGLRAF